MKILLHVSSEVREMPFYRQIRFLCYALLEAGIKKEELEEVGTFQFINPHKTLEAWLADDAKAFLYVDNMDTFRPEDYDRVIQIGEELSDFFKNSGASSPKLFKYDYLPTLRDIIGNG